MPDSPNYDADPTVDERLRTLFADAASGAPSAPGIEHIRERADAQSGKSTNRWMIGGAIGLAAAAAVAAFLVIPGDTTDTLVNVPATRPYPTTVPATTDVDGAIFVPSTDTTSDTVAAPPESSATSSEPSGASLPVAPTADSAPTEPNSPEPVPAESVDTRAPEASTSEPVIVRVGPDVAVERPGAEPATVSGLRAAAARFAPSGLVDVQPSVEGEPRWPASIAWDPANGDFSEVVFPRQLDGLNVDIQDAARVDGRSTLLITAFTAGECGPQTCESVLGTWTPDDGEWNEIERSPGWEAGFGALSLADNGRIVGTRGAEAITTLVSMSITDIAPVDLAALGLDLTYEDLCDACPDGLTIDQAGEVVAWAQYTGGDPSSGERTLVIARSDGSARAEFEIASSDGFSDNCCASIEIHGIRFSDDGSTITGGRVAYHTDNGVEGVPTWELDPVHGETVESESSSLTFATAPR